MITQRLNRPWLVLGSTLVTFVACRDPSPVVARRSGEAMAGSPSMRAEAAREKRGFSSEPTGEPQQVVLRGGLRSSASRQGMVVSVERHATEAGVRILSQGGNAADAAVATGFALAVTHPSGGGLGGGGFAIWRDRAGSTLSYDFRERSPKAFGPDELELALQKHARNPASIAVPGHVAGLHRLHEEQGLLPLEQVLAPAIELADKGFLLQSRQARVLRWAWREVSRQPGVLAVFGSEGSPKRPGQRVVQSQLARTLKRIATRGRKGFYDAETFASLRRDVPQLLIGQGDLVEYRTQVTPPRVVAYRGSELALPQLPSAGGVAVSQMLGALQAHDYASLPPSSVTSLHLLLELDKRAQIFRRTRLAAASAPPLPALPSVDLGSATPAGNLGWAPPEPASSEHTTHFSVVDAQGNAVSCSITLSASFGSTHYSAKLGFFLNNSLAAFSRSGDNAPSGRKRMWSSMAPAILSRQGSLSAVVGSPGGDTIPSTVVRLVTNLVDGNMPLDEAVDAPRAHYDLLGGKARLEAHGAISDEVLGQLTSLGHVVWRHTTPIGDANSIVVDAEVAYGYADPREGGLAAGPLPK